MTDPIWPFPGARWWRFDFHTHTPASRDTPQLIVVTHNPNEVVNGDAEMVHAFDFRGGQCRMVQCSAFRERSLRAEVCRVMEGGREALARRWARLGREV